MTDLFNIKPTFAPLPAGKFSVILADNPWEFRTYSAKGQGKSPQRHYECLPTNVICQLPVADVAADDCALFMWGIWPMIFDTKLVGEAWGFKYSGLAWEWIKRNPVTGKYPMGGGYGTRKNLEPCLLFRRGKPKLHSRSERDFMYGPRREHSRKPDEQYERIGRMYPHGPRLELFARQAWPNWTAWGNQTDRFSEAA